MSEERKNTDNTAAIQTALTEHRTQEEQAGSSVTGLQSVPLETQVFRAETLEVFVANGIPINKMMRIRSFLERHAGHRLIDGSTMMRTYLKPLQAKEQNLLQTEHCDDLISIYHDETTHNGESFAQIYRRVSQDLKIILRAYSVSWLKGSLDASQIGSVLVTGVTQSAKANMDNVVAVHNDSVAANVKVFNSTLHGLWLYCDMNLCLSHGGHNTFSKFNTSTALDTYLSAFVKCISLSNYARSIYFEIFGKRPLKKSNTRWFSEVQVVSGSIYPGLEDGRMLEFVTKLQSNQLCEASAIKMMAIHANRRLFIMLWLEAAVISIVGMGLMTANTSLQGDGFEFITGYSKVARMETLLNNPVTLAMGRIIDQIAEAAPGRSLVPVLPEEDAALHPVDLRLKKLCEISHVAGCTVSVGSTFWDWDEDVAGKPRYKGVIKRWGNKSQLKINILWEDRDAGKVENLCNEEDGTQWLMDPAHDFQLESWPDGTDIDIGTRAVGPFLLSLSNLKDPEVLMARAAAMVAPAAAYFKVTIMQKRKGQLDRMRAAQMFDPLYNGEHPSNNESIDNLHQFRMFKHRRLAGYIGNAPLELHLYNELCMAIPARGDRMVIRRNGDAVDSFDIRQWWLSNRVALPNLFQLLRAVLLHSPNSCPPERLFSILNDSFEHDQNKSYSDYIELSLKLQYNNRTRS